MQVGASDDSPPRGQEGFASKPRPGEAKPWSCTLFESPIVLLGMALAPFAFGEPAVAADAAWLANPADGDFNNTANWDTAAVPDGTATFDASSNTNLSITSSTTVGGFTFNAGAYTFAQNQQLQFTGAGIIVNGGSVAITDNHIMNFLNASTAGDAAITNNGTLAFYNTATAGNATIVNNAATAFGDTATAGNATISNDGTVVFLGLSTAGTQYRQ
ncbi:MAG: hypothetical protein WAN86_07960 [Hyphomicrobiaceae bacterium]